MLTNSELTHFLVAIVALLAMAHGAGYLFQLARLPRVIGEIAGGFLLGPSVLGLIAPELHSWLIGESSVQIKLLSAFYWIGLTLLMYTAGFRMQYGISPGDQRMAAGLLLGGTVLPFLTGWYGSGLFSLSDYAGPASNALAVTMVISIACAVTSIPVIARIFMDNSLMETRFARIVMIASTVQDVILWAILAVATGIAASGVADLRAAATPVGKTVAFCALAIMIGMPLLIRADRTRFNFLRKASESGYALVVCFLLAALAALLDVNVVFGALLAGILLARAAPRRYGGAKTQIMGFSQAFFIPIYFAMIGLRIDIPAAFDFWLCFGFLGLSTLVKGMSVYIVMRLAGCKPLDGAHFAMAMNTRGGPGIVLASVGYDLGIIDQRLFLALVFASIATSAMSGFWFGLLRGRWAPLQET